MPLRWRDFCVHRWFTCLSTLENHTHVRVCMRPCVRAVRVGHPGWTPASYPAIPHRTASITIWNFHLRKRPTVGKKEQKYPDAGWQEYYPLAVTNTVVLVAITVQQIEPHNSGYNFAHSRTLFFFFAVFISKLNANLFCCPECSLTSPIDHFGKEFFFHSGSGTDVIALVVFNVVSNSLSSEEIQTGINIQRDCCLLSS